MTGAIAGGALGQAFTAVTVVFPLWGVTSGAAISAGLGGLGWLQSHRPAPRARWLGQAEPLLLFAAVGFILINSAMPYAWIDTGATNLYVYQAQSFLAGRLDVGIRLPAGAEFEGKHYLPFHPLPALVLLPLVWWLGGDPPAVPVIVVSAVLVAGSAVLLRSTLRRLRINERWHLWTLAAFVFGSGLWMVMLPSASPEYFAQIVAVPCLLLAIRESLGRGRGVLAGLYLGMAFLSRPLTILAVIFLIAVLLDRERPNPISRSGLNLAGLFLSLGVCVGVALTFNYLRFGNLLDNGYTHQTRSGMDLERFQQFGLFNLAYVPQNLYYTFLHGFQIEFRPPLFIAPERMNGFGTSLPVANPFLLLGLWAQRRGRLFLWGAWLSISLNLLAHLLYLSNGFFEINTQRYMLDYLPILILLVALSAKRHKPWVLPVLVTYSVALNLFALFVVPWTR